MAIFQSSVLNKYLKQQDDTVVAKAYKKYTKYFHDATIQQNIKDSNEEQYQAKFLDELFVNILGYTLNPHPKFNLATEFKNAKNSKKADGAILLNNEALAVIELKGTNTKDLESIRKQAFDYKANQPGCVYVVTSNFEKLRFYINNAVDFEEFDLFNLSYNRFELLYLCLYKNHLLKNLPLEIKEASIHEEEAITKKFYSDYSRFKRELFRDIVKRNLRNPTLKELDEISSKKTLFKKTQKLLDRFLFIFFGEDRGLLPPNSIPKILEDWKRLKDLDAYTPLYSRYKKYFNYLNEGWKGKEHDIFAYNGGLFKPDSVLDTIEIDDELLYKHTAVLTKYDFESQVDVNILGHIFEHSLNEIESVNAEIEGVEFDKQKSKRKKDGVFYTPKYITKYIVDNTVGKLCEEKKAELEILEEEYLKGPKHRAKKTIKKLDEQLQAYRNWLLTLTICDPACGSGAFLNQALDFLIQEHRWIDEMTAKLFGGGLVFQDVENSILENNIYGVDLNDESVEIAKLSLWLRTAQKGRKLTSLNNNIKCGNSLIDSKAVAGDKAFKWEDEFPEVFAKGGFDVVIGNPPYVNIANITDISYRKALQTIYKTFKNKCDLYSLFIEKSIELCKKNKMLGFIFPNSWMGTDSFVPFRKHLIHNTAINAIVELPPGVFKDAIVTTVVMVMTKKRPDKNHEIELLYPVNQIMNLRDNKIKIEDIIKTQHYAFSFEDKLTFKVSDIKLGDVCEFSLGIKTSNDKRFVFDHKMDENCKPMLRGKNIGRYFHEFNGEYLWYMPELIKEKSGGRPRVLENFLRPKIIIQDIAKSINATYEDSNYLVNDTINFIYESDNTYPLKSILGLLNSKLVNKWFSSTFPQGLHIKINQLQEIPLPIISEPQKEQLIELVDKSLKINAGFSNDASKFLKYLLSEQPNIKLTRKLQSWYNLDFSDFIKELNKAIKKAGGEKLSKMDEMEWMELFETKKKEALELKGEIDRTDREIDQLVYELYGLTDEEIGIVEEN